jgi:hypothetical protein
MFFSGYHFITRMTRFGLLRHAFRLRIGSGAHARARVVELKRHAFASSSQTAQQLYSGRGILVLHQSNA